MGRTNKSSRLEPTEHIRPGFTLVELLVVIAIIGILPNGDYVASHSFFGPGTNKNRIDVFSSNDRGTTWSRLTTLTGQWWSNLFVLKGDLYIMGTSKLWGHVVIRRSKDGGKTWTTPRHKDNGVLLCDARYHTAPVPALIHGGRIWRAMEVERDYPHRSADVHPYRSFVMSAPVDADLLKAENWTTTNYLKFDLARVGKKPGGRPFEVALRWTRRWA